MENITAIKNYILFLKNVHNLSVTLHPLKRDNVITPSELISFNIHDNSYCVYLKANEEFHHTCIKRQKRVLEKLKDGPFCGTCYAGVKEYVYPISNGAENIGFISVSGYMTEEKEKYIKRISSEFGFQYNALCEIYGSLNEKIPEKGYIDTLIQPLCQMLELAFLKNENKPAAETLPEKIVRYIKINRNRNITSKDICRHFSCNRSYMSAEFNKYTGKSIRNFINELRVEDAKLLLVNSSLSVTEIALSVGFCDSNYFSNIFKKTTGEAPLKYRKTNRTAS